MNIFFFSYDPWIDFSLEKDLFTRFKLFGTNTGNQLFVNGLMRHLRYQHCDFAFGYDFNPEYVNKNFDMLVIPAANWANPIFDYKIQADMLEKIQIPICTFGLGAQASNTTEIPKLQKNTLRLLKIISEKSYSIGLRGEFTQRVLAHYGITNTTVIGCPSLYWNHRPNIFISRVSKIDENSKIAINATRYDSKSAIADWSVKLPIFEKKLYQFAFENKTDIIYQSEIYESGIIENETDYTLDDNCKLSLSKLYGNENWKLLLQYISEHGKVFYQPDSWIKHMARYDFTIGTRLHGCIAALLAGRPSCLLKHDSRTQEMLDFLKLPHISAMEFCSEKKNLNDIYQELDYEGFVENYPKIYKNFINFIEENSLAHNLDDIEDYYVKNETDFKIDSHSGRQGKIRGDKLVMLYEEKTITLELHNVTFPASHSFEFEIIFSNAQNLNGKMSYFDSSREISIDLKKREGRNHFDFCLHSTGNIFRPIRFHFTACEVLQPISLIKFSIKNLESTKKHISLEEVQGKLQKTIDILQRERQQKLEISAELKQKTNLLHQSEIERKNITDYLSRLENKRINEDREFRTFKTKCEYKKNYKLIKKSKLFNNTWYLNENHDVFSAKIDPLKHYLLYGQFEGREPAKEFNEILYLSAYTDIEVSKINPFLHYIRWGKGEGRNAYAQPAGKDFENYPQLLEESAYFNAKWYLSRYPDVAVVKMNPIAHYLNFGAWEGRNPSEHFDTKWYLSCNPHLKGEGINPLIHFILWGKRDGRLPKPPTPILQSNK